MITRQNSGGTNIVQPVGDVPSETEAGIVQPIAPPPYGNVDIVPPIGTLPPSGGVDIVPPIGTLPPTTNCLGPQSAIYASQIQAYYTRELQIALTFQALARRNARYRSMMRTMANEHLELARQLRSAHFIITGVQLSDHADSALPLPSTYEGALRYMYRYLNELNGEFSDLAGRVQDVCLRQLYLSAATTAAQHRENVRAVLASI